MLIEPPPPPFQPETKREYLVIEILTTERTYVTNLKCLIETFLIPLRGQYKALLISHSDIEILFSNVEDISKINSALLEEVLLLFFFCFLCSFLFSLFFFFFFFFFFLLVY